MDRVPSAKENVLHLEKLIGAPVDRCMACFRNKRALAAWYDPSVKISAFKLGAMVTASYFPSYQIVSIVKNQLIAQQYVRVVDGLGLFSFVRSGKKTRVIFDHIAKGNKGTEIPARTFHWQGLLENLAALCEKRPILFVGGRYPGKFPKGIRHATCEEFVRAWPRKRSA